MAQVEARFHRSMDDLDTFTRGPVEQLESGEFPQRLVDPLDYNGMPIFGAWQWATYSEQMGYARYLSEDLLSGR